MTDRLEHLVISIEGEGPTPDFVERLRTMVIEESTAAGRAHADAPNVDIAAPATLFVDEFVTDVSENGRSGRAARPRRWVPLLASAAAIVLVAGLWAAWVRQPPVGQIETTDSGGSLAVVDEPDAPSSPTPLAGANTFIENGRYRIDTLGTAFTFSVDELTGLLVNDNGIVVVNDVTSTGVDDRSLTLTRLAELPSPFDPTGVVGRADRWPANDFRGWLDVLQIDGTVGEPLRTTVGGRDALRVDVQVGELGCRSTRQCVDMTTGLRTGRLALEEGSEYSIWFVDQNEEAPVAIVIAIAEESQRPWVERAERIVATIEFDATEVSPVRQIGAGRVTLDVFGGIDLEGSEESLLYEPYEGFARLFSPELNGSLELVTSPQALDGSPLHSTDDLLDVLDELDVTVIERQSTTIGGLDARAFDVTAGAFPEPALTRRPEELARPEAGWRPPHGGDVWVVEHPRLGLLLMSAEASGPDDVPAIQAWSERLVSSIEFAID